jgi:hypothetical protein
MTDQWGWPKRPNPPPLTGGREHPDQRLRRAALSGLLAGLLIGFAAAWLLT